MNDTISKQSKDAIAEIDEAMNAFRNFIKDLTGRFDPDYASILVTAKDNADNWTPKYQEEFIAEKKKTLIEKYKPEYESHKRTTQNIISYNLEQIHGARDRFFSSDVHPRFLEKLRGYKEFGIKPSFEELKLLGSQADGYAERLILDKFIRDTYAGDSHLTMYESVCPVTVDIKDVDKAIAHYEDNIGHALGYYVDADMDMLEITGHNKPIDATISASADAYWVNNASSALRSIIDRADASILHSKTSLTDKERTYLDTLFSSFGNATLNIVIKNACAVDERLRSLVQLSPKYSVYLN